jgi:hypothetical protein
MIVMREIQLRLAAEAQLERASRRWPNRRVSGQVTLGSTVAFRPIRSATNVYQTQH